MASRTRVYVGKVSTRTRESDLRDLFSRYGHVRYVDVKYGFAFVEFENSRDAEEAVRRLDDYDLDGSRLIVEFSRGGRERGDRGDRGDRRRERGPSFGPPQRSDYRAAVENLPRDMSWQDLKDFFRAEADVIFADVWQDRSGKHCGAVEFRNREELRRAISRLDGTEVRGSRIRIEDDSRSRSRSRTPPRKRRRSSRSRSPRRSRSRSPRRSASRSPRRRRSASRSPARSPRRASSRSPSPRRSPARSRSRSPRASRSRSPARRSRTPPSRTPSPRRRDDDEPDSKRPRHGGNSPSDRPNGDQ